MPNLRQAVDVGVFYFVGKWLWKPFLQPFLIIMLLIFSVAVIGGEIAEGMKPHLAQSAVPQDKINFSMSYGDWSLENLGDHAIGQVEITCRTRYAEDNRHFVTNRLEAHSKANGFLNEMREGCEVTNYVVYAK